MRVLSKTVKANQQLRKNLIKACDTEDEEECSVSFKKSSDSSSESTDLSECNDSCSKPMKLKIINITQMFDPI